MDVNHLQPVGRRSSLRYVVPVLIAIPVLAILVFLFLAANSSATITTGGASLANLKMPFGGGTVTRVSAVGGTEQKAIAVTVSGDEIWPSGDLKQGEHVTVVATVRRPGWISWLAGASEKVRVTETTPRVALASQFVTRRHGQPLRIDFARPVALLGTHAVGSRPRTHLLSTASSHLTLDESAPAGTVLIAASPRSWEKPVTNAVSWFPAGTSATAVASPAPGSTITPNTKITLTFSKAIKKALDGALPPVTPAGSGSWRRLGSHTLQFDPSGYGYGLGATVSIRLPAGVELVGGTVTGSDPVGKWTVPGGTTESLQALLADLGYLPLTFTPASGAPSPNGESAVEVERQAVSLPQGHFAWQYPNTPPALKKLWSATNYTELTKGAVMAFENANNLAVDGIPGPSVWRALIADVVKDQKYSFGYTFVQVHEGSSNESEETWHDGKMVVTGPANTGIAAAPTATGTYAVYEHVPVTTMSGLNPNGTPYHDPGIKWVSYFNGGDALHEYPRASYGFPQSLGCVEMPMSEAAAVFPYTPIGTIVQVQ